jgi:hypothetical protein
MKSSAPAAIARVFSWRSLDVTITTGSTAVAGSARNRLQTSYPSSTGISTSSRTRSGCRAATASSASPPSAAVTTS